MARHDEQRAHSSVRISGRANGEQQISEATQWITDAMRRLLALTLLENEGAGSYHSIFILRAYIFGV